METKLPPAEKSSNVCFLKNEILQLEDNVQNYYYACKSSHGIDQLYSRSTPCFNFEALLKHTRLVLDYKIDDKYKFLLDYSMGRNPVSVMGSPYAKEKDTFKIQILDLKILFVPSKSQFLPTGNSIETEIADVSQDNSKKNFDYQTC